MFINTSPVSRRTCILKSPHLLAQELDDSKDIMCAFVVDKYLMRPTTFENISLAEYIAFYTFESKKIKRRKIPHVIRYVRYNQHIDPDNFYREKLMLFLPYRETEENCKHSKQTWYEAFLVHKLEIESIEKLLFARIEHRRGDIDDATSALKNKDSSIFDIDLDIEQKETHGEFEKYDIQNDMHFVKGAFPLRTKPQTSFQTCNQPLLLNTHDYFEMRKQLNEQQQSITNDILI